MNPLTNGEKLSLFNKWGAEDSQMICEIIERHKREQNGLNMESIIAGSSIQGDDDLLLHAVDNRESVIIHEDGIQYDQTYVQHVHQLIVDDTKNVQVPLEYTFCFYCDAGGIMPNMYLEGGKDVNQETKMELPFLLQYDNQCLVCLSIHTWAYGESNPTLSMEDKVHHVDNVHRWMQRIMNIRTLDKIKEIIVLFPMVLMQYIIEYLEYWE